MAEIRVLVVLMTTPPDAGDRIARALVERGLAACVNVLPSVRSFYRWQGAVQADEECLLVAKTTTAAVEALTAFVRSVHPYENFELIALPVEAGSQAYLDWVISSTSMS